MRMSIVNCAPIVILIGETDSNIISAVEQYEDAATLGIEAPAILAETVAIHVSNDGTNFSILNDGITSVLSPGAGTACAYPIFPWNFFKLVAGGAVAAEHTFKLSKTVLGD